ncbi:hypothetical protein Esti_005913 [Eimeria stiedai]
MKRKHFRWPGPQAATNGFFIKEGDHPGSGGLTQIFIDAVWVELPALLEERTAREQAAGKASLHGFGAPPQQSQPSGEGGALQLPEPPQLVQHQPQTRPYSFPGIPGDYNILALQELMRSFHSARQAHNGKRSGRCLLEVGEFYVIVGVQEVAVSIAAQRTERVLLEMLEEFVRSESDLIYFKRAFDVVEFPHESHCGEATISIKVYRSKRSLSGSDGESSALGAAGSTSSSTPVSRRAPEDDD